METYKRILKKRTILCGIIAFFCFSINGLDIIELSIFEHISRNVISFQHGLLVGIGLCALLFVYRYGIAMKSESKMKKLYNSENDERQILIRQKAGMPMLMITSCIMIFAGIFIGFFNETAFITLTLAALVQMIIGIVVKTYHWKRM